MTIDEQAQILSHLRDIRAYLRCLSRQLRVVQIEVATDACREIERTAAIDARLSRIETTLGSNNDVG